MPTVEDFEEAISDTTPGNGSAEFKAQLLYEYAKKMAISFANSMLIAEGIRNGSFKRMTATEEHFNDWESSSRNEKV